MGGKHALTLTTMLLIMAMLATLCIHDVKAYPQQVHVKWVRQIRLTSGDDYAYGVCYGDGKLFVVGSYYNSTNRGASAVVAMLDPETGETRYLAYSTTQSISELYDCDTLGNYVVGVGYDSGGGGQWLFLMASTDFASIQPRLYVWNLHQGQYDAGFTIASNGTHLGAAGVEFKSANDLQWVIAILTPSSSGITIHRYTTYDPQTQSLDFPNKIASHPHTRDWWIVGNASSSWHIVVMTTALYLRNSLRVNAGQTAWSIVFDEDGNGYVVGYNSIRKYSSNLSQIGSSDYISAVAVAYVNGTIISISNSILNNTFKPNLTLLSKNLDPIGTYILNHTYPGHIVASPRGKVVVIDNNIYFAGWIQHQNGDYDWVVYCLSIQDEEPPIPIPEPLYTVMTIVVMIILIGTFISRSIVD